MEDQTLVTISNELFTFLYTVHEKIMARDDFFKGMNMPPSHMKVILYLAFESRSAPEAPTITEIAQHLAISKSNMTPIIDKLLLENMIDRVEDPKDRRVLRIALTQKAWDLLQVHANKFKETIQQRIVNLSTEDLATLNSVLPTITTILKRI